MTDSKKSRILVVDDDAEVLRDVKSHLEKLGYEVRTAADGRGALALAKTVHFDLVVLDINFPELSIRRDRSIDGIEVLRLLRDEGSVPVLMLSSTNISSVKVMALTLGADDYVPKPFDLRELGARIEAILRRSGGEAAEDKTLNFRRLRLDPGSRRVWKDDVPVDLTGIEFDILYTLSRRPEHVFTRDKLIELAWKDSYCVPKAVDVHIGHIRKKIEDDQTRPTIIVTVRGTGYRFEDLPA